MEQGGWKGAVDNEMSKLLKSDQRLQRPFLRKIKINNNNNNLHP